MTGNQKAVIWAIISTAVVLGLISLVKMGNIIFLIPLFFYFSRELQMYTGMDAWLAKAIVILLVIPFFFSIKEAISLKKEKRTRGGIIFSVLAAMCFLGLYAEGKAHFFDFKTGEAMRYYAETPEGVRFFDEPGFDPKFGIELKPVTKEVIKDFFEKERTKDVWHNPPGLESIRIPKIKFGEAEKTNKLSAITNFDGWVTIMDEELQKNKWTEWFDSRTYKKWRFFNQETVSVEIKNGGIKTVRSDEVLNIGPDKVVRFSGSGNILIKALPW